MRLIAISIFTLISIIQVSAQGMEFFHGSWEEALEEAKKLDKLIFVDAYTTWCGPCKRMSKNVFPQDKVGNFYNKHFVNVKLDMEKGEGIKFKQKYPVSAYPTLYYIDYTGEIVQVVRGAQTVDGFIGLGEQALSKVDRSDIFGAEYEKGNRDPELVYNYVKSLNRAGKSSLAVANEYFDEQEDLSTEQNLRMILEACVQADSKIFEWLITYRDQIADLESEQAVRQRIEEACHTSARKAMEFQSEALLDEAIDKLKKHHPEGAEAFEYKVRMDYYLTVGDAGNYVKISKKYAKKQLGGDAESLHSLANTIKQNFWNDLKAMKQAEDFAKEAAEKSNRFDYYLTYADILSKNGKKAEAMEAANRSLELAKGEGPHAVRIVEQIMNRLNG